MPPETLPSPTDDESVWSSVKKYPPYVDAISSALTYFLKAKDWTDLIKSIKRVQSVLESSRYAHLLFIPHKHLLAKRLAQSLSPALPSGVHLHALTLLDIIFTRIGPQLAFDLPLYSVGLFPLSLYCATPVKPVLLKLFDKHLLNLGPALLACLPSLLGALFPGLEEEGSENYDETLELITSVKTLVSVPVFTTATWRTIASSPPSRYPALSYVSDLLKIHFKEVIANQSANETILIGHAIENCLKSENTLVQRAALDLLVTFFPLSLEFFDPLILGSLFTAVCFCLCKRELSLTRRIWKWMLGRDDSVEFFLEHSKKLVIQTIKQIFSRSSSPIEDVGSLTLPYQVVEYLLSKAEVGSNILVELIPEVLYHVHHFGFTEHPEKIYVDKDTGYGSRIAVIDSCVSLLSNLNVSLLWNKLNQIVSSLLHSISDTIKFKGFELACIIFDILPMLPTYCNDSSSFTEYFNFINKVSSTISGFLTSATSFPTPDSGQYPLSFEKILTYLISFYNGAILAPVNDSAPEKLGSLSCFSSNNDVCSKASFPSLLPQWFKEKKSQLYDLSGSTQYSKGQYFGDLYHNYVKLLCFVLQQSLTKELMETCCSSALFVFNVLSLNEGNKFTETSEFSQFIELLVSLGLKSEVKADDEISLIAFYTVVHLHLVFPNISLLISSKSEQIIGKLWTYLDPVHTTFHQTTSSLLASLDRLYSTETSKVIIQALTVENFPDRLLALDKFNILWTYSITYMNHNSLFTKPLFIVLEYLLSDYPAIRSSAVSFCTFCCESGSIASVLDPLCIILLDDQTITDQDNTFRSVFDFERVLYVLNNLLHLVKQIWPLMKLCLTSPLSSKIESIFKLHFLKDGVSRSYQLLDVVDVFPVNYYELLVLLSFKFIDAVPAESFSNSEKVSVLKIENMAVELFSDLCSIFVSIKSDRAKSKVDTVTLKAINDLISVFRNLRSRVINFFFFATNNQLFDSIISSIRTLSKLLEITEGFSSQQEGAENQLDNEEVIEFLEESLMDLTTKQSLSVPSPVSRRSSSVTPSFSTPSFSHSSPTRNHDETVMLEQSSDVVRQARELSKTLAFALGTISDCAALRSVCLFSQSLLPSSGKFINYFAAASFIGINRALRTTVKHLKEDPGSLEGNRLLLLGNSLRNLSEVILSFASNTVVTDDGNNVFEVVTDVVTAPFRLIGGFVGNIFTETTPANTRESNIVFEQAKNVLIQYLPIISESLIGIYERAIMDTTEYLFLQLKMEIEFISRIFFKYLSTDYCHCLVRLWFMFMSSKVSQSIKTFSESDVSLLMSHQRALLYLIAHEVILSYQSKSANHITFSTQSLDELVDRLDIEETKSDNESSDHNDEEVASHSRSVSSTLLAHDLERSSLSLRAIELGFVQFSSCLVFVLLHTLDKNGFKPFIEKSETTALNIVDLIDLYISDDVSLNLNDVNFASTTFASIASEYLSLVALFPMELFQDLLSLYSLILCLCYFMQLTSLELSLIPRHCFQHC
ncbi:hypothetical protein GEMRC1_001649 [Eukaryota sp. GEM-RC1]